jgi:UDP-hydrolysing UDP-N-acetyl-D-glucosamine 2-epimerase
VVTGTRADYGLLATALAAIHAQPRLDLKVVATGMHLLRKFGYTVNDIVADGWTVDARVVMQRGTGTRADQADGLARGIAGIARFVERCGADIVLVLGDRIEAMAGALAGVTTGRLVAHIHGGDLAPGDADDALRHAVTKLAHLHLTASEAASKRIVRMGEPSSRVVHVGAPGLDRLLSLKRRERFARDGNTALVVHHPIGRSDATERRVMTSVLEAARRAGLRRTIIYPNSDPGHNGIIAAIERHCRGAANGDVQTHRSLHRDDFLALLLRADVLIGNSSSGVIESAAAGTRAVNIGARQQGRQRDRHAVIDADETAAAIRTAIDRALTLGPIRSRRSVYGDGRAGARIAAALAACPLDEAFRRKRNAY